MASRLIRIAGMVSTAAIVHCIIWEDGSSDKYTALAQIPCINYKRRAYHCAGLPTTEGSFHRSSFHKEHAQRAPSWPVRRQASRRGQLPIYNRLTASPRTSSKTQGSKYHDR
jgi:hypothetical protein